TFATSPNRRVSCAAASPRTLTTSDSRSLVRSAARSAMSSRSHSVADITARCIAHAMSVRGGARPALTRSKLPAGSGKRRTEWDSGGPNERHYLDRMALPRPLTKCKRTRTSALRKRRKKKPAYRTCQASRVRSGRMLEDRDDVENVPDIDPQRRRSRHRARRDGLADQTVIKTLENVRSYRAFERVLIG